MANNRMNLVCPCGDRLVLARVGVGSPEWDAPRAQPTIEAWLREHETCDGHPRAFDYSAVGFRLEYEADECLRHDRTPAVTEWARSG